MNQDKTGSNNDVHFNFQIAGGWQGKKKFPQSLEHFSQLKMHRSFDHGVDNNAQKNALAVQNSFEESPDKNQPTGYVDVFAKPDEMIQILQRSLDS